jgi:hypothetical protein
MSTPKHALPEPGTYTRPYTVFITPKPDQPTTILVPRDNYIETFQTKHTPLTRHRVDVNNDNQVAVYVFTDPDYYPNTSCVTIARNRWSAQPHYEYFAIETPKAP